MKRPFRATTLRPIPTRSPIAPEVRSCLCLWLFSRCRGLVVSGGVPTFMPASSADGGRGVCRRRRVRKMEENRCFRQTGGREADSFCRIRQHNRSGRGFGLVSMRIPADEIADCRMTAVRYGYVKSSPFGLLRINVTTRLRAVRRLILFLVEEIYQY